MSNKIFKIKTKKNCCGAFWLRFLWFIDFAWKMRKNLIWKAWKSNAFHSSHLGTLFFRNQNIFPKFLPKKARKVMWLIKNVRLIEVALQTKTDSKRFSKQNENLPRNRTKYDTNFNAKTKIMANNFKEKRKKFKNYIWLWSKSIWKIFANKCTVIWRLFWYKNGFMSIKCL